MCVTKAMFAGMGKIAAKAVMDKGSVIVLQQSYIVHGLFAPVQMVCKKADGLVACHVHPTVLSV